VENAFGILSSRFRVLRNPILQNYKNAIKTVKATIVLHNYLIKNCNEDGSYFSPTMIPNEETSGVMAPGLLEQDQTLNNLQNLSQVQML